MKTRYPLSLLLATFCVPFLSLGAAEPDDAQATSPGVTKVVHIQGMDKTPVPVHRVAPAYPLELRARGVQGFATVDLLVDASGRVVEVSLVRATNPEFGARALEAAEQWTFEPAEARGQKIRTRVQVPFQFVMPQVAALEGQR